MCSTVTDLLRTMVSAAEAQASDFDGNPQESDFTLIPKTYLLRNRYSLYIFWMLIANKTLG